MYITFTDEAIAYIESKYTNKQLHLKFIHDTKGSGCADNGVPTLAFIATPSPQDLVGQSNYVPFYFQPEHAVYYEPSLKIGFNKNYYSLTLSSDGQLYSNAMRLMTLD